MKNTQCAGYSILFALLITGIVVASATAVARVILVDLRLARNLDAAMVSYTAAEANIERTLFFLRKTTVPDGQNGVNALSVSADSPLDINGARVTSVVKEQAERTFYSVSENNFIVLDIPENKDLSELTITEWIPLATCANASFIEVTGSLWDTNGAFSSERRMYSSSTDFASQRKISLFNSGFFDKVRLSKRLIVRIKPLYCDALKLTIEGKPSVPGQVMIKSVGEFNRTVQSVQAVTLRNAPLSGMFDFVLFSQCPITKDEESSSVCTGL